MNSNTIIYLSSDSNKILELTNLKVGDTLTVKLERVLGNAENWRLANEKLLPNSIKLLKVEEPEKFNEDDGNRSYKIYTLKTLNKANAVLYFEFGRLLGKSFEILKPINLEVYVR